jgi:lipase chaperone LimK
MNIDINIAKLRRDLINYFGTAMNNYPMAISELSEMEKASSEKLIEIAEKNNFDLRKYYEYK